MSPVMLPNTAFSDIETEFEKFHEKNHTPGLAYGLVVEGELVTAGGMGIQNTGNQLPVTPDSVFRIASMTKSFTAMAIVKLRDDGKLQLDCPAAEIVPELTSLRYPTRDSAPITIRDLLTMSAGFPQDDPWADRQLAAPDAEFSAWMRGGISFSNPPGVIFEYSNYAYAILGRIVANASGMPYQKYVEDNILKPLSMTSTTFDVNRVSPDRLAMGYRRDNDQWVEDAPLHDGAFAPMGGLFTTISDFARYMAFLLSAFPPHDDDDTGPVRRSSLREMQQSWRPNYLGTYRATPDAPTFVVSSGYGYGLGIGNDSILGYTVAHGGGLPGYGSFYRLLPDYGVGLAAFTNLTYMGPGVPVTEILNRFQKAGAFKPRTIKPTAPLLAVQDALTRLYDHWDDSLIQSIAVDTYFLDAPLEKRRQQFADLRRSFAKCVSVSEIEPENALRGRWTMKCRGGRIELFATLSPTVPPKLQYLTITAAKSLSPSFKQIVVQMVRLINQWDDAQANALLDRKIKPKVLRRQFDALRVQYGKLRLGEVLDGDGTTNARLRLHGQRGMVDIRLVLNPKTGRVTGVVFTRPRETQFVP